MKINRGLITNEEINFDIFNRITNKHLSTNEFNTKATTAYY